MISNEEVFDEEILYKPTDFATDAKDYASFFKEDTKKLVNNKIFFFKESPKISTYIFAICAGPYGFHQRNEEGFPNMRIYARRSLVASVSFDEMFTVTQAGMNFYMIFFGKPYPFFKYD